MELLTSCTSKILHQLTQMFMYKVVYSAPTDVIKMQGVWPVDTAVCYAKSSYSFDTCL